jgi:hypothetical protein
MTLHPEPGVGIFAGDGSPRAGHLWSHMSADDLFDFQELARLASDIELDLQELVDDVCLSTECMCLRYISE